MSSLRGVVLSPLEKIISPQGVVFPVIKNTDVGYTDFREAYFSTVGYSVIKPWKKHLKMTLNVVVPVGKIKFVIFDDRPLSTTINRFMEVTLAPDNYSRLTIPPNLWVAFKGESQSSNILLNIADIIHDPSELIRTDLEKFPYEW